MTVSPRRHTADPDLDEFRTQNLGWLLLRAAYDFQVRFSEEFEDRGFQGLRPAHATVLGLLPFEGARLTDLAESAQMTKQSMGELVDQLEELGYVERVPDEEDGRAKKIVFTEGGMSFFAQAREANSNIWREYASMLGEHRLVAFRRTLDSLLMEIDARADD